jgi:acetolactate synthase-1/2/3 large subunit
MKLRGAEAMIESLKKEEVKFIFGLPGAAICPFYDALVGSGIKHILTRHEQGAAHAASGYARVTGKTGVCVATSGPGATNLITGIATAYMDSIPVVAITGQVQTNLIGRDVFQEADITGATAPFCKHNYLVKDAESLPRTIKEAFLIASTGRPGPVLIDVPLDVQKEMIDFSYPDTCVIRGYKPVYKGHHLQIKKVASAISKSQRPVICAGGGVINSGASDILLELAEKCSIPVTTTLMGIGSMPSNHPLCLGMLGSHGSRTANYAIYHADVLIIIGARVGNRAMGATEKIARKATIIHIDIDPAEIGKNIETSIPVVGDVREVLKELHGLATGGDTAEWIRKLDEIRNTEEKAYSVDEDGPVNPRYLLNLLSSMADEEDVVTTEVGQNQIWAANHFTVKKPRTFISSGGLGTMGYGLPAAIGAKIGKPEARVIVISGDGSFQMTMQELGTIKQYGLGIKVVLFNNRCLGMVKELQKMKYCGRYSEVTLEGNPDFIKLAGAYGFRGEKITVNRQVRPALERMLADQESYILECEVDPDEPTLANG